MKRMNLLVALFSASLLFASCGMTNSSVSSESALKMTHTSVACFPRMTVESISQSAEYIVHGIITKQKDAVIFTHTFDDGYSSKEVFTPYEIRITDDIKGNVDGKTIDFLAYGGETDTDIYIFDGNVDVEVGDEVLVFLNERGISWGAQGVYIVKDGNVRLFTHMLPDNVLTSVLTDEEESDPPTAIESSLDDYMQLISEYVNE